MKEKKNMFSYNERLIPEAITFEILFRKWVLTTYCVSNDVLNVKDSKLDKKGPAWGAH